MNPNHPSSSGPAQFPRPGTLIGSFLTGFPRGFLCVLIYLIFDDFTVHAQSVTSLVGSYQREPMENPWHEGEIRLKQDSGGRVLEWVNKARASPQSLVPVLEAYLSRVENRVYQDPQSSIRFNLHEGEDAVLEAIAFLKSLSPRRELQPLPELHRAAELLAADLGRSGEAGHTASDGSSVKARVERFGKWAGAVAENLSLADCSGKSVVTSMLIDDGNASRSQRKNLFHEEYASLTASFARVGVACAHHCKFQVVTVLCFVVDFAPHPPPQPPQQSQQRKVAPAEQSLALEKDWDAEEDWWPRVTQAPRRSESGRRADRGREERQEVREEAADLHDGRRLQAEEKNHHGQEARKRQVRVIHSPDTTHPAHLATDPTSRPCSARSSGCP